MSSMPDAADVSDHLDRWLGCILHDRYRVLKLLGSGGMGVVYLAEHVLIRRKVAVKMLHPSMTRSEESIQRLHREARVAAAAGDEHVVDVMDMGRLPDGSYYVVMEYLEGQDLATLIEEEGPLAPGRAVALAVQICMALEAVHRAGIVHRDLKPENVFLTHRADNKDFVKVLDFGVCKVLDELPLTATGIAIGTPRFMSPEQLEARPEVDARADVYGVGIILFYLLTGRGPFDHVSLPKLLVSIWSDPAPPVSSLREDVPADLVALIARTLEKSADKRFSSASALREALEPFLTLPQQCSPAERPTPLLENASTRVDVATPDLAVSIPGLRAFRRRTLVSLTVLLATLAGVIIYASTVSVSRPRLPEATAASQVEVQAPPPLPAAEATDTPPTAAEPPRATARVRPKVRVKATQPVLPDQVPTEAQPTAAAPVPPSTPPTAAGRPTERIVPVPQQLKSVF